MKITINCKTIDLPEGLTAKIREIIEAAEAEEKQPELEKCPFERAKEGDTYFYIDGSGDVGWSSEDEGAIDDAFYAIANYCTDRDLMEQRALHETLNRLLWRYSEEHGGDAPWDGAQHHWLITRRIYSNGLYVDGWAGNKVQGVIYFRKEATAQAAIRDIVEPFLAAHPDFVW